MVVVRLVFLFLFLLDFFILSSFSSVCFPFHQSQFVAGFPHETLLPDH